MNHSFKIPDRDYELARQLWGQSWASELRRIVTLELAAEARRKDTPPTSPQLEVVRELASVPPAFELRAITEETIQDAYEVRLSNGQFTRQIVVISLPSDSYGKVERARRVAAYHGHHDMQDQNVWREVRGEGGGGRARWALHDNQFRFEMIA